MKAIVVRQPWASLIAHGIKTIETRPFQPRTTLAPGDRLAIVAGKATHQVFSGDHYGDWRVVKDGGIHIHDFAYPDTTYHDCPLGAVVAVVTYDGSLPILRWPYALSRWAGRDRLVAHAGQGVFSWLDHDERSPEHPDQLPLGDFTPGRYGWLLSDPQRIDPVPVTGKQGVFTLPDDVTAEVLAQIGADQ